MHTGVARNVTSSTSTMTISVQGATRRKTLIYARGTHEKCLLHGLKHNRVVTHAEVVVGTPNFDLILAVTGVGDGELVGETVNVVEVTVRGVLVLLLKLGGVELLVVETSDCGRCFGSFGGSPGVEGTSSGSLGGRGLGGSLCTLGLLSLGKVLGHASGSESLGGMGALLDIFTGGVRENTLVVVNAVDLGVTGYASITGNELTRANLEGRTHDGTFGCLLGEL